MMATKAGIAIGVAASAAGAALLIYGGSLVLREKAADGPAGAAQDANSSASVCLRTKLELFAGADEGCYTQEEAAAFADAPVLDSAGDAVTVSLSHPSEMNRKAEVSNCADWRRLTAEGWHALSTAEMRREAWFTRACGVAAYLEKARRPDFSHFRDGAASAADIEAVAATASLGFAPESPPMAVAKSGEGEWRLSGGGQAVLIQEIAHADFNGDGLGDILVFINARAEGGTATASQTGLIEKKSADAEARLVGA